MRADLQLTNQHLTVSFQASDGGPRLVSVLHRATGQCCRFVGTQTQELALAIVRPEQVDDPHLQISHTLQNEFRFQDAAVSDDRERITLRFVRDDLLSEVVYELHPDMPVLRKAISCTAGKHRVYLAGISLWNLQPIDWSPAWPADQALGQPVVLLGDRAGCFLALEWPRAQTEVADDGVVRLGYRPGFDLPAGESREIATGAIGLFEHRIPPADDRLEEARKSFFRYVVDRARPQVPFPVKFTTWGPWLGQARADRLLEVMDDMADVGVDLVHFDAGWQHPDYPYSRRLPRVRDADDITWDRETTQPERLPNGLLPIKKAANQRGMNLSLWFDSTACVFLRESEEWAVRDAQGNPVYRRSWEGRWPTLPAQSPAVPEYVDALLEFMNQALTRYDLHGVMFDNIHLQDDHGTNRRSLACGWNAEDVQLRGLLEIFDEFDQRQPGIYRFFYRGIPWPWVLKHATHIHAGDPGTSTTMKRAAATDYPARAMAHERHLAWRRYDEAFVPPWGIKGDIAGWSVQQFSPIPVNLQHTDQVIPSGEGWTYNMFMCFATTAVRDLRFSFRQMPHFDKQTLKEWLAWDRRRSQFIFNCRPLFPLSEDPNHGIDGMSHVGQGQGVIYLFNRSFDTEVAEVKLDERAGFRAKDVRLPAFFVYPMKAPVGPGQVSYGDTISFPISGKDCVAIEIGLEPPPETVAYNDYQRVARSVRRSFHTVFLTPVSALVQGVGGGPVRVETGDTAQDRRLASQIMDTLGACTGSRVSLEESRRVPAGETGCRLIIGTHEGLVSHPEVGGGFREALYNRFVVWDNTLYSAPLLVQATGSGCPTFCLVAPRPEQLARLATELVETITADAAVLASPAEPPEPEQPAKPHWLWRDTSRTQREIGFDVAVPPDRPVLRFLPVISQHGHPAVPNDLEMVVFEIHARSRGQEMLFWREEIPPFCGPQWWQDRLVSLTELAGQKVKLRFTCRHVDGGGHPQVTIGFERVALLRLQA